MKHNKKRNTAFLYECLVKELTKSIVRKQNNRKKSIVAIVKEYFSKGKILAKDLMVYRSVLENKHKMTNDFSKRFLQETKKDFYGLDRKGVFNSQTKLINQMNNSLGSGTFNNFVSNYKNIATVGQWFNSSALDAKSRLLIESKVLQILVPTSRSTHEMKHIDNLTYNTFASKFNETYKRTLKERQKTLLTHYITSFSDNGLGLKSFMNEEIGRLKHELSSVPSGNHDQNLENVINKLNGFAKTPINEGMVKALFYIQNLTEVLCDAD